MLSKVFTKAIQSVFIQAFKNKQICQHIFKTMATSEVARIDKGKQKLSKAITREIKFEEENYRNDESVSVNNSTKFFSEQFCQKFLEQNGFNLRDDSSDNIVELTKKIGNATVQVVFQSRPPQLEEENEEAEESHLSHIQKSQEGGKYCKM